MYAEAFIIIIGIYEIATNKVLHVEYTFYIENEEFSYNENDSFNFFLLADADFYFEKFIRIKFEKCNMLDEKVINYFKNICL